MVYTGKSIKNKTRKTHKMVKKASSVRFLGGQMPQVEGEDIWIGLNGWLGDLV
jgi:hypothetical protein